MSFSKELLLAALRGHTDKPIDPIGKELREDLKECEPKPAGAGGGVSSWNDIPDRPFGETEVVILEEQELAFNAEMGMCMASISVPLNVGDTLRIKYDGSLYECEVRTVNGNIGFGNKALMGMDNDTGEPFGGAYADGTLMLLPADMTAPSHTVEIAVVTYNKIPAKFYTAQTVFYGKDGDQYLYKDVECTTKICSDDVARAMELGVIAIQYKISGTVLQMELVVHVGFVGIYHELAASGKVYYTAEYTPE